MAHRIEISSNHVYWAVVFALTACTLFFVISVQQRRQPQRSHGSLQLESGALVSVSRVIDADELAVRASPGGAFVVRLLGVKGFPTTVNDPGTAGLGAAAVRQIEQTIADQQLRIVFEQLAFDSAGRVLAYLEVDGVDLGEHLVRTGDVVTYHRYAFSKEHVYEGFEAEARANKAGLWGNERAVSRVLGWQDTWKAMRAAGE